MKRIFLCAYIALVCSIAYGDVVSSRVSGDWSGGSDGEGDGGTRYYKFGRRLRDVIRAMLMDGYKVDAAQGRDITFGSVNGINASGESGDVTTGFFDNVGHRSNPVNE